MRGLNHNDRRVVSGFKPPSAYALTENERQWIEMMRIIFNDAVPAVDLPTVTLLRKWADKRR